MISTNLLAGSVLALLGLTAATNTINHYILLDSLAGMGHWGKVLDNGKSVVLRDFCSVWAMGVPQSSALPPKGFEASIHEHSTLYLHSSIQPQKIGGPR